MEKKFVGEIPKIDFFEETSTFWLWNGYDGYDMVTKNNGLKNNFEKKFPKIMETIY